MPQVMQSTLKLSIVKLASANQCQFMLEWDNKLKLPETIDYPPLLEACYANWQRTYIGTYRAEARGQRKSIGNIAAPVQDYLGEGLCEEEAKFSHAFLDWLKSLHDIPQEILKQAQALSEIARSSRAVPHLDILLTCSKELVLLPWEWWPLGEGLTGHTRLRISRVPEKILSEPSTVSRKQHGKIKVLVILGDNTQPDHDKHLQLQQDQQTLEQSLKGKVSITVVQRHQVGESISALKQRIIVNIKDPRGWDLLFFAGHSNETAFTGGKFSIADNEFMSLTEIESPLRQAQKNGLQCAIFNSCEGVSIAHQLIDWGFGQVVVMREKISSSAAHKFLTYFLEPLAKYKDIHDSLITACRKLEEKHKSDLPSVYLIPSLFRHPQSTLFRLRNSWEIAQQWLPTKYEGGILTLVTIASVILPLWDTPLGSNPLLQTRVWIQALYRDWTSQVQDAGIPPVLLITIPSQTRGENSEIVRLNPINRDYLGQLVTKSSELGFKVIGLDFVFHETEPRYADEEANFASAIGSLNQDVWVVFGSRLQDKIGDDEPIMDHMFYPQKNLQGYVDFYSWYVELLESQGSCVKACPLAYILSISKLLKDYDFDQKLQPYTDTPSLQEELFTYLENTSKLDDLNPRIADLSKLRRLSITNFFLWFSPIIDFSVPPEHVYQRVISVNFLSKEFDLSSSIQPSQQVVLIAPGGYPDARATADDTDNFPVPLAVDYWRMKSNSQLQYFVGGEAHAYMIHHLLFRHLVTPIPDLWIAGIFGLIGKALSLLLQRSLSANRKIILIGVGLGTAVYIFLSFQAYISHLILVPITLPLLTIWLYIIMELQRTTHE